MLARERFLPDWVKLPIESQIRIVESGIRNLEREIIREQELRDAETDPQVKEQFDQCIAWLYREIEKEEFNLKSLKEQRSNNS